MNDSAYIKTLIFPNWDKEAFYNNEHCHFIQSSVNLVDLIKSDTSAEEWERLRQETGVNVFKTIGGSGLSIMHLAARVGNLNLIEYILKSAKADERSWLLNISSMQGETPMCMAISGKDDQSFPLVAKRLIQLGANINYGGIPICSTIRTPLDRALAAPTEDLSLVQLIIFNGGKVSIDPIDGRVMMWIGEVNIDPTGKRLARCQRAIKAVFEHFKCLLLGQADRTSILCQSTDINELLKEAFFLSYAI